MGTYREQIVDVFAFNLYVVRVDVLQELHHLIVADAAVVEVYNSEIFLRKVMSEKGLEIG